MPSALVLVPPPCQLLQKLITLEMTHCVIDGFEVVKVNEQQAAMGAFAGAGFNALRQTVEQHAPIGQLGQ